MVGSNSIHLHWIPRPVDIKHNLDLFFTEKIKKTKQKTKNILLTKVILTNLEYLLTYFNELEKETY
jgi:hypothetical protein